MPTAWTSPPPCAARGHEVAFLATSNYANVESEGEFVPATVTRDDKTTLSIQTAAQRLLLGLLERRCSHGHAHLANKFPPDVISAHKLYPPALGQSSDRSEEKRVPVIQTVHDYEFVSASPFDHTGQWIDHDERRLSDSAP